jgi:hypothetical protein
MAKLNVLALAVPVLLLCNPAHAGIISIESAAALSAVTRPSDRIVVYTPFEDKTLREGAEPVFSRSLGIVGPPGPAPRDVLFTLPGGTEGSSMPSDILRLTNRPFAGGPDRAIRLEFRSDLDDPEGLPLPGDLSGPCSH